MPLRPDAAQIRQALAARNEALVLGGRDWWKKYAFHFTDLQNASGILEAGAVLCRSDAIERGLMFVENADTTVIARHPERTDQVVRMYFRPRTPTQFRNEGIRPIDSRPAHGAHCPVPVFFLFDLEELLVQTSTLFTDCAAYYEEALPGGGAAAIREAPWREIYSIGAFPPERRDIIGRRHAEILVDQSVPADHIIAIVCRSGPERDALLHRLPNQLRDTWRNKVRVAGRAEVFEGRWTYLESVKWAGNKLLLQFSPPQAGSATFTAAVTVVASDTGERVYEKKRQWTFSSASTVIPVEVGEERQSVTVTVVLDDALAYEATVTRGGLLVA